MTDPFNLTREQKEKIVRAFLNRKIEFHKDSLISLENMSKKITIGYIGKVDGWTMLPDENETFTTKDMIKATRVIMHNFGANNPNMFKFFVRSFNAAVDSSIPEICLKEDYEKKIKDLETTIKSLQDALLVMREGKANG